jgi:hypothetical protein
MIFSPFSFLNTSVVYNFTPQSLDWQTAIINNGGSMPNATLQIFDNYFFKPMISASLLDEFDRINIYVGTGNQIAARTSLVSSSTYFVTPVSSPEWNNTLGYRSTGTSYLNLNYTPSTQARRYLLRGGTAFYMSKNTDIGIALRTAMGGHTAGGNAIGRNTAGSPAGSFASSINAAASFILNYGTFSNIAGYVLHTAAMSGSGATNSVRQTIYSLGTPPLSGSGSNISAPFIPAASQFELTNNSNGTPGGNYELTAYHMASAHGSFRLYQSGSNINSILTNLFTQLGV